MEYVPRISRAQSMDALSSQSLVAGYRGGDRRGRAAAPVLPAQHDRGRHRAAGPGRGARRRESPACRRSPPAGGWARWSRATTYARPRPRRSARWAPAIELDLPTLEGAGGYAREMTEERAPRQRELLAPYIAAADALITTAAVPGRQAPVLVTRRDGGPDEAGLGRGRPGRRVRRQRRGRPSRGRGAGRRRSALGRGERAQPDAGPGQPAVRPERGQRDAADDPRW